MSRLTLFTCNHPDEAFAEYNRLHKLFVASFKRAMLPELFFFDQGEGRNRFFGVSVHWDETRIDAIRDLEWLKGAVTQ